MQSAEDEASLKRIQAAQSSVLATRDSSILPQQRTIDICNERLHSHLPLQGIGIGQLTTHLLRDVCPGLNRASLSPRYYGFVIGGVTPAAHLGDVIASTYDQNVMVHLPEQSVSTNIDRRATDLLLDLFKFDSRQWSCQLTTGATAGNVLGLTLGREYTIGEAIRRQTGKLEKSQTVSELGILRASRLAHIKDLVIFSTKPHSSLVKAASIAGFGRSNIVDQEVGADGDDLKFDLAKLESQMIQKSQDHAMIVAVSCGEINTGLFATSGLQCMQNLRTLCDRHHAWLHVDGAFGVYARLLDGIEHYQDVANGALGLELADSIASDGHKTLNVPYDCGIFLQRKMRRHFTGHVFRNANAQYLSSSSDSSSGIGSLLNEGIENSQRFRSLPVYASLVAYGRQGYQDMLARQVDLARAVALYLSEQSAFELLPIKYERETNNARRDIFMVVLFRVRDDQLNRQFVRRVNETSMVYLSGTSWKGQPAARLAVANWQANVDRDLPIIRKVFEDTVENWSLETLAETS